MSYIWEMRSGVVVAETRGISGSESGYCQAPWLFLLDAGFGSRFTGLRRPILLTGDEGSTCVKYWLAAKPSTTGLRFIALTLYQSAWLASTTSMTSPFFKRVITLELSPLNVLLRKFNNVAVTVYKFAITI